MEKERSSPFRGGGESADGNRDLSTILWDFLFWNLALFAP